MIIVWYFAETGKKKKGFGDEIEELLFDKKMSPAEFEKQIKKEYGISVEIEQEDNEKKIWKDFFAKNFLKGYAVNEPEYFLADVREPNPEYKKWKKAK